MYSRHRSNKSCPCFSIVPSEDDPMEVYDMLKKNFERAYYGKTRAPLGYFVHAAWWASEELEWRFEGFK